MYAVGISLIQPSAMDSYMELIVSNRGARCQRPQAGRQQSVSGLNDVNGSGSLIKLLYKASVSVLISLTKLNAVLMQLTLCEFNELLCDCLVNCVISTSGYTVNTFVVQAENRQ